MTVFQSPSGSQFHLLKRGLALILLIAVAALTVGCAQTGTMDVQPRYDPLELSDIFPDGRSARSFPPNTVPQLDTKVDDPALTGVDANGQPVTGFPVQVTNDLVRRGRERFAIYCTPCHGEGGQGDGRAVAFGFPAPPNLFDPEIKGLPNGEIFGVITNGFGIMFPYGYRVKAADRWAIIAYVRAMQLKNGPVTEDLTPDELNQLGAQP